MLIQAFMTRDIVTVQSNASVAEVRNLLAVSDFHRVPILEGDKLVGIVNWHRLVGEGPVSQCMVKNPVSAPSDTPVEEAARIMIDNRISALPVVDGDELVGIMTMRDLFTVGVTALGARDAGVRITLLMPEMRGMLADVINALANLGAFFVSLVNIPAPSGEGELVTIKVQDVSQEQVDDTLSDLSVEVLDIRTI
jgi:acetoin utilization protein AcuB